MSKPPNKQTNPRSPSSIPGNGQIEYQEFVEMLNKEDDDSALMESFRVFDKNGDGFISIHELKQVIASLGEVID